MEDVALNLALKKRIGREKGSRQREQYKHRSGLGGGKEWAFWRSWPLNRLVCSNGCCSPGEKGPWLTINPLSCKVVKNFISGVLLHP